MEGAVVVDTVGHIVPVAGDHGVPYLREVVEDGLVQRGGAPDGVLVDHLQHAPEGHPVPVVPGSVPLEVGCWDTGSHESRGPAPLRWVVLQVLDVGGHPKGHPGAVGPAYRWPVDDGRVVEPLTFHSKPLGGERPRRRCLSYTMPGGLSSTGMASPIVRWGPSGGALPDGHQPGGVHRLRARSGRKAARQVDTNTPAPGCLSRPTSRVPSRSSPRCPPSSVHRAACPAPRPAPPGSGCPPRSPCGRRP